jgi:putative ABC transport system permease protein
VSARRRGPIGLAVRAALTTPALSVFAILIVAATAFVGSAAPGLLQQAQTRSLQFSLEAIDPALRDVTATARGIPEPGNGPTRAPSVAALPGDLRDSWGLAFGQLDDARDHMDPAAREVLGPPQLIVRWDRTQVIEPDETHRHPRSEYIVAFDPFFADRVTWADGEAPEADADGPLQVAATTDVATATGWRIGETRRFEYLGGITRDVVLTGLFRAADPADGYWQHVPLALENGERQDGLAPPVFSGTVFGPAGELASMESVPTLTSTTAWYPLELGKVHAAEARAAMTAIRSFTAAPLPVNLSTEGFFDNGLTFTTSSTLAIETALLRIDSTSAIVALIAGGPLAVALVVLALTARMLAVRRRPSIMLAAARGASVRQLGALLAIEGLALGLLGAVGGAVAGSAVGGGRGLVVAVVPALIALTPTAVLPVAGLLVSRRRVRTDVAAASRTVARWRLAGELAVVGLAAAAVGLVLSGARSSQGGVDPLLTAVPLLLAGVGCVVTLRIVPLVLAAIERGVPGRRGLLALVGPARARRDPEIRVAPVLAVVVGVAISVFSVAFFTTVQDGIQIAARSAVGADMRVTAPYLGDDQLAAIAAIDGVANSSPVYAEEQRDAELPDARLRVTVYVIDVAELRTVQTDPATAIPLPDGLIAAVGDDDPVPVIASERLAALAGDEQLEIVREAVDILAAAPTTTPLGSASNWVAVDRRYADRLVTTVFSPSVVLLDLDGDARAGEVAKAAVAVAGGPPATATTPAMIAKLRLSDPALNGVRAALAGSVAVVALLLALAIGMTLVLGAPARGRLLALLGALGFRRSRELPIVLWEVAPAVAVALPVGVGIGLLLPWVVIPAIDLTGFVGGSSNPAVHLGGGAPALVAAAFLVVTALAVLVAALVARRVTAARTLRSIDEEG